MLLIRWHMGGFVPEGEQKTLFQAIEDTKAIVAIHTADFESSNFLEETLTDDVIISMTEYNKWKNSQK